MKTTPNVLSMFSSATNLSAIPVRSSVAAAAALAVMLLAATAHKPAQAQDVAAAGPKPSLWIEPRISVGTTLSSNGNLSSTNPRPRHLWQPAAPIAQRQWHLQRLGQPRLPRRIGRDRQPGSLCFQPHLRRTG
jgi:hypothetical protein